MSNEYYIIWLENIWANKILEVVMLVLMVAHKYDACALVVRERNLIFNALKGPKRIVCYPIPHTPYPMAHGPPYHHKPTTLVYFVCLLFHVVYTVQDIYTMPWNICRCGFVCRVAVGGVGGVWG